MEPYTEVEDFELAKCANCQRHIGIHEGLCLACTREIRSEERYLEETQLDYIDAKYEERENKDEPPY